MPKDKTTGGTALGGGAAIVHEDDELIVVDKPAGMISGKPDDTSGKTLFHLVKAHAGERARRGRREGEQRAWIIHRLDRDVSGLLVFAKTHTAYLALKDQLQRRQVRRRYLAMVRGEMPTTPPGQWQWIDAFLADAGAGRPTRLARPGKMDVRRPTRRPGKPGRPVRAVTYYRVLTAGHRRSLLVVRLDTGRRHQIRAHLAGQGHPVIGDRLYGKGRESIGKLALHAWELSFAHPATGQVMRFVSPPPADFLCKPALRPTC